MSDLHPKCYSCKVSGGTSPEGDFHYPECPKYTERVGGSLWFRKEYPAFDAISRINSRDPLWWQQYGGADFCLGCGIKLGDTRITAMVTAPEPPHEDDCPVVVLLDMLGNETYKRENDE